MEAILTESVQNSLRQFMYRNAIFMSERLCAEFPSETNSQLLACCYLHNNQSYAAYQILKGSHLPQSRYLFALSCFQLDLLQEAERALCPPNEVGSDIPNGAAGHFLLGLIYRYTDRKKAAVHQFNQALLFDPLLWSAYEELCILGAAQEADNVFGDSAYVLCNQKHSLSHEPACRSLTQLYEGRSDSVAPNRTSGVEEISSRQPDISENHHDVLVSRGSGSHQLNGLHAASAASFYNTPSPMPANMSGVAPPPVHKNVQVHGMNPCVFSTDGSVRPNVHTTQAPRRKFVDEGKLRKVSGRLFTDSGPRRSTRLAGESLAASSSLGSLASGNGAKYRGSSKLNVVSSRPVVPLRKGHSFANENSEDRIKNDASDDSHNSNTSCPSVCHDSRGLEQEVPTISDSGACTNGSSVSAGISELLALLRNLGEGFRLSCLYNCQDALDVYLKLPYKHYNTGFVLTQVGKAYFEMVDYLEADHTFSLARLARPYSLEGMDIYSTVLYHLKEDMKLSYLAQELIATDRFAPQSWCAMGNCYSLQKDHETALKNFQRAVKLNPRFAYAHTLSAHEYVALEDFENGIKSYQNALHVDARHYNAWYGLGMVYFRQEKFEFSEHHLRMACQINPHSSVVMSYLGANLHHLKRNTEALEMIERAIKADRKNPLPLYEKAKILVSMENFDDALEVLEELKEYVPKESSVYALMGRIYKRRNMYDMAMLHFGHALDLKPSTTDVAAIKAAIEKLHVPDDMEDSL